MLVKSICGAVLLVRITEVLLDYVHINVNKVRLLQCFTLMVSEKNFLPLCLSVFRCMIPFTQGETNLYSS